MRITIFILVLFFCFSAQTRYAQAQDCTGPSGDHGVIIYNEDYSVWQGCTPRGWIGLNSMICPDGDGGADPCSFEGSCSTPSLGTQCGDGSYYIGNSPEDDLPVFMTSIAHQITSTWHEDPPCFRCGLGDTGATSETDGRANVEALRAYGGDNATAGNLDGFAAAKYCDNLEAHTHDDWYLPAGGYVQGNISEQLLFFTMTQAVGIVDGMGVGNRYFSSTEDNTDNVRLYQNSASLTTLHGSKANSRLVRCVRR